MAYIVEEESVAPSVAKVTAAAVTTDAEGAVTTAVGAVGSNSPIAAANQMAVVATDSDGGHGTDNYAPARTRRSSLDHHCRQRALIVPVRNPTKGHSLVDEPRG
jgi:hypothetical protein